MAGEMWTLQKTPLGEAIKAGNPKYVKKLIAKGENPLFMDRKGNTYLHYVCTMYKPYVINVLIASGIPINAQNKFGSTALHVTALHDECCHVPDLMQYGVDPYVKNKLGKTAADIASGNPRWMDLYTKYEPTLRVAIERRDVDAIRYLFGCWSAVHLRVDVQNDRDMRQYAAGLTFHDIVTSVDNIRFTLMAVHAIMECDLKQLRYALSRGPDICNVNFLQQVRGGHPHHMLQHAIRLRDYTMVDMLLEAGADVNVQVHIHEYIRGPLYFEVIQNEHNLDMEMVRKLFACDIDMTARDERGRSALVYCIDKRHGDAKRHNDVTLDMVNLLLEKGINIGMRDNTGCTARDVALFARRKDIVSAIDQHLIDKIRKEDVEILTRLAMDNYRDIFINYSNRDTWIYAAGNETDDVLDLLDDIPKYWKCVDDLHNHIVSGDLAQVHNGIRTYPDRHMLLGSRDKGGRGPMLLAILHGRTDIAEYFHKLDNSLVDKEIDNNNRCVWHYVNSLSAQNKACFTKMLGPRRDVIFDVCGNSPDTIGIKYPNFIAEEQNRNYGMTREVHCMNKYEELRDVIRSKKTSLKHFNKVLSTVRYPVAAFHDYFHPGGHPLVTGYEDLLHYAVRYGKEDVSGRLVRCKVDCSVRQKYKTDAGVVWMAAEQRAMLLGLHQLADYIREKGVHIHNHDCSLIVNTINNGDQNQEDALQVNGDDTNVNHQKADICRPDSLHEDNG